MAAAVEETDAFHKRRILRTLYSSQNRKAIEDIVLDVLVDCSGSETPVHQSIAPNIADRIIKHLEQTLCW